MSGLMNLFGQSQSLDSVSFAYDPHKQAKPAPKAPQQPQFPFQSNVQLFHYDQSKNENQSYGVSTLQISPNSSGGYNLIVFKDKDKPFINCPINESLGWDVRSKQYAYVKEPSGIQWTMTFPDAQMAARASISIGSIVAPIANKQVSFFDALDGNGDEAQTNDTVAVSYMGFSGNNLPTTGAMFDSNENYSFQVGTNKVIKGYSIGVSGMKVGGSRVVLIPPEFGYGLAGAGNRIPPNATLAFFITLKSVTKGTAPPPQSEPQQQQQSAPAPTPPPPQQQQSTSFQMPLPSFSQSNPPPAQSAQPPPKDRRPSKSKSDSSKRRRSSAVKKEEKPPEPKKEYRTDEIIPTADEEYLLEKVDQLSELIQAKYDSLVLDPPVPKKSRDLVYEVQALAAKIASQEIKLRNNQEIINELQRTKQNSRLRAELDVVQTELESLKANLKGGIGFRRENEELKAELRNLKENDLHDLQNQIAETRVQLTNERDISRRKVGAKAKELFYQFQGTAVEKVQQLFLGADQLSTRQVVGKIYDIFHQCSEDIFKQIDQQGMLVL